MFNFIISILRLLILIIISILVLIAVLIYDKKNIPKFSKLYFKLFYYSIGLNKPIIKDLRKDKTSPKIIIFQHNSYLDPFIVNELFNNLSFVITNRVATNFYISLIAKNSGYFFVEKGKTSKKIKEIVNYSNKILAIAPDAGNNSRNNLFGEYKTGAFICMKPVTPIIFVYSSPTEESNALWADEDGIISWFRKKIFCKDYASVKVYILDEIKPKKWHDPKSFAKYTENIMKKMYEKLKKN